MASGLADYSAVTSLAIDETSRARGHQYVTLAADADERRVIFVGQGRSSQVVAELAEHLDWHGCSPQQIRQVSIDMSAAYIKGVSEHLPNAQITNDQVPRHRSRQRCGGKDPTRRAARRPRTGCPAQGHALDLAQGCLKPQA